MRKPLLFSLMISILITGLNAFVMFTSDLEGDERAWAKVSLLILFLVYFIVALIVTLLSSWLLRMILCLIPKKEDSEKNKG